MEDTLQSTIELALILLLVIFAVAVLVERIKLPYTIALLLVGLLGFQRGFHDIHLTPDLILLLFLPVLLFEGAYHVRARRLWENALPIGLLAIPGVLITAVVTGAYYEKGVDKGKSWERRGRFTDTWMNLDGRWQCIASHFSVKPK
jgi:CPA1 family monovalent cation:H+ antiporter